MPWTADVAFVAGIEFFDRVVRAVDAADWQRPSPCAGWTATDVLGHVGAGIAFGTELLRGGRPAWHPVAPPGRAVPVNPALWWAAMVEPAKDAVRGVDLAAEIDSPTGRRTIGQGLSFPTVDLFIHGWDLARATRQDAEIPDEAIECAYATLGRVTAKQLRNPQVFADELPAPANATPTQRFIAFSGRNPNWTPDRP